MHYFKRNIGDYAKKAGRLSMLQHGSYTLLIDACYDREQFPTKDEAIEWTWAASAQEIEAVEFVLRKFFILEDGRYVQQDIQRDIADYHAKAANNKRIADEREAKRRGDSTNRERTVDEAPPNHKPLTTNQEPEEKGGERIADACPHSAIVDLFHERLPTARQVRAWTPARQQALRARWREDKARQNLEWWGEFFDYIARSDFLCGRSVARQGGKPFEVSMDWICKQENFVKVLEGAYEN